MIILGLSSGNKQVDFLATVHLPVPCSLLGPVWATFYFLWSNLLTTKEAIETLASFLKDSKPFLCSVSSPIRGLSTPQLFTLLLEWKHRDSWTAKSAGHRLGVLWSVNAVLLDTEKDSGSPAILHCFWLWLVKFKANIIVWSIWGAICWWVQKRRINPRRMGRLTWAASNTTNARSCTSQVSLSVRMEARLGTFPESPNLL